MGLGEGQSLTRWWLSLWETRLGKAMSDKEDEKGEGPLGAHQCDVWGRRR